MLDTLPPGAPQDQARRRNLPQEPANLTPVEPPADIPDIQRGNWLSLPGHDPIVAYSTQVLWDRAEQPTAWEVARLSGAAYVYRESPTGWAVVAKFYAVKTGSSAQKYASREFDCIRRVQAIDRIDEATRAVGALALWRGVLFLEYVPGLTLEDVVAVRRGQPGRLTKALESVAQFLVALHVDGAREHDRPDFKSSVRYAHGVVEQLAEHGVLQDYPITRSGVVRLIDRWAARSGMEDFVPTLIHGDATTTNFVLPSRGGIVVVDWERLSTGDPAFDLGRLMAEVTHSINQHGGSVSEAEPYVEHLVAAYRQALPKHWDDGLVGRARFYRASSTLRIARNGWVSRLDRTALVAQAMALLTE